MRAGAPGPTRPHDQPPRPRSVSILKLSYYAIDYVLGYWLRVRPLLVRSTLVLFDRYYADVLVDPQRYRYGGPMGFARLIATVVPKADVILVLDAPERELLARKEELDFEKARDLRQAYRHQAAIMRDAELLDASHPREVVTHEAAGTIVAYLERRCPGARVTPASNHTIASAQKPR
jgi:thymidylate kinase